jgi:hypothetical protein
MYGPEESMSSADQSLNPLDGRLPACHYGPAGPQGATGDTGATGNTGASGGTVVLVPVR